MPFFFLVLSTASAQVVTNWDGLTNWMQTSAPGAPFTSVASSADGAKLAAVALGGGIYTSTDSGLTWILETNAPMTNWVSVASSSNGSNLVAAGGSGVALSGIWTSHDAGNTWSQTTAPSENWYSVASSSSGSNLVALSVGDGVWTSTNSGADWTFQEGSPGGTSVASSADGNDLYVSNFGDQIWASTDAGITWTLTDGEGGLAVACSSDGTKVVTVSSVSTNSGSTWMPTDAPNLNWFSAASSSDGTRLVAAAYNVYPGGIWTAQAVTPANGSPLSIGIVNNGFANYLEITWRNIGTWSLYQNTDLNSPGDWTPSFVTTSNGTNYMVMPATTTGNMFFRLEY